MRLCFEFVLSLAIQFILIHCHWGCHLLWRRSAAVELHSFLLSAILTHFVKLRLHQSITSLVQVLLCFPLYLVFLSFLPSVVFCFPFPHIKCPKYCSFLSGIVLRGVCFAIAISKTSTLVFLFKYNILNIRRKNHISKALILSSICLVSVHDSEAYKKMEST